MNMPSSLSDFSLISVVCEVRYSNAYLLFDKTGEVLKILRENLTNFEIGQASPQQTSFKSDEGTFGLEIAASRIRQDHPDSKLDNFSRASDGFFLVVLEQLQISLLTRIGMRTQWKLDCESVAEANEILTAIKLFASGRSDPFDIGGSASEFSVRWQSGELGVWFSAKSIDADMSAELPAEFGADRNRKTKIRGLLLDVDYYTVAPVDSGQWKASEWITASFRRIKKNLERLIEQ